MRVAFIVIFGLINLIVKEKLYVDGTPIKTIVDIIISPNHCLDLFNHYGGWGAEMEGLADDWTSQSLEFTRVVILLAIFVRCGG